MKKVNQLLLILLLFFATSSTIAQNKKSKKNIISKTKATPTEIKTFQDLIWYTDVLKADSVSKKTSKPIFGFFTGSDWCGWCHKLQREVFEKPEFVKWATQKVVLLELDYPRRKALAPALQQQNAGLQQAFQVQGFPTIWMFYIVKDSAKNNAQISALGSLGYPSNAVAGKEEVAFLETANSILAKEKNK